MFDFPPEIRSAFVSVESLLLCNTVPFLVYLLISKKQPSYLRITFVVLSCSLAWLIICSGLRNAADALLVLVGLLYFVTLSYVLYYLMPQTSPSHWVFGVYVVCIFIAYLVVPAVIFPVRSIANQVVLARGWERCLAAYSYFSIDSTNRHRRADLQTVLFFLHLSPELVFRVPSRCTRTRRGVALARCALGGVLLLAVTILEPKIHLLRPELSLQILALVRISGYGAAAMLLLYAAHSGLAHLQIGLCATVNFHVRERYNYPLLATTPREFWQRWNTYMGDWIKQHVFSPLVLWRRASMARRVRAAVGTFLAFLLLGVLHDIYQVLMSHRLSIVGLLAFAAWGLELTIWAYFDYRANRTQSRLFTGASFALVLQTMLVSAWALR